MRLLYNILKRVFSNFFMKSWPSINVNTYDNKSLLVFSQRKKKKCLNNTPIYKKRELEVTGKNREFISSFTRQPDICSLTL